LARCRPVIADLRRRTVENGFKSDRTAAVGEAAGGLDHDAIRVPQPGGKVAGQPEVHAGKEPGRSFRWRQVLHKVVVSDFQLTVKRLKQSQRIGADKHVVVEFAVTRTEGFNGHPDTKVLVDLEV